MPQDLLSSTGKAVGTKLYFPYNSDDIYEGGRSIFYASPHILQALHEQFGLGSDRVSADAVEHDFQLLQVLDELPSLDGFLMSDGLRINSIAANELYFEVPDDERQAIHAHITDKLRPLVQAAFGSQESMADQVSNLVTKIWEAKDEVALGPLIKACRFPQEEALAIFSAWKGILFYTYEYERTKQKQLELAVWLRDNAVPNKFAMLTEIERIRHLRRKTIQQFRLHWTAVEEIARTYQTLYTRFLTAADGVAGFIDFLRGARQIYWRMGDSLSKLGHAVNCWSISTKASSDKQLPPDKLHSLLEVLNLILVSKDDVALQPKETDRRGSPDRPPATAGAL
jgi:hypothetical protein